MIFVVVLLFPTTREGQSLSKTQNHNLARSPVPLNSRGGANDKRDHLSGGGSKTQKLFYQSKIFQKKFKPNFFKTPLLMQVF